MMNLVRFSQEVDALYYKLEKATDDRAFKDLKKCHKDFKDEWKLLEGPRRPKTVDPIPWSGQDMNLYKKIAKEFGLPGLLEKNPEERLDHWYGSDGRRAIVSMNRKGNQGVAFILKFFLNHKDYDKYRKQKA